MLVPADTFEGAILKNKSNVLTQVRGGGELALRAVAVELVGAAVVRQQVQAVREGRLLQWRRRLRRQQGGVASLRRRGTASAEQVPDRRRRRRGRRNRQIQSSFLCRLSIHGIHIEMINSLNSIFFVGANDS